MKIIIGLGNPGKKYENTRHNAGFLALDRVAKQLNVTIIQSKFKALIAETFVANEKVILVKPQTFMNLSGESVREVLAYYQAGTEDIVVLTDDKDLDIGRLRLRPQGSSGGQKGIQSIINNVGTQNFKRVKIGIGSHPHIPTVDYVLGKLDSGVAIDTAADAVVAYLGSGDFEAVMTRFNAKDTQ